MYVHSSLGGGNNTYDVDGNMTTHGVWTHIWNGENMLPVASSSVAHVVVRSAYDHQGHRITKSTLSGLQSTVSLFIYDNWNPLQELITHSASSITTTTNHYVWGLDLPDYVDTNGDVAALDESGPFGGTTTSNGTKKQNVPYCFSTKYLDEGSSLYCYGARSCGGVSLSL